MRTSTRNRLVAFADSGGDEVSPKASPPTRDDAFDEGDDTVNSDAEGEALLRMLRAGGDGQRQSDVDAELGDEANST